MNMQGHPGVSFWFKGVETLGLTFARECTWEDVDLELVGGSRTAEALMEEVGVQGSRTRRILWSLARLRPSR